MCFEFFEKSLFIWFCWVFMAARAFLQLQQVRATIQLWCTDFSLWWLLLLQSAGSRARGLQSLRPTGSVVVAPGLQSIGSILVAHRRGCPMACEIFPDQGSNLCLMHWQADSLPPSQQETPRREFQNFYVSFFLLKKQLGSISFAVQITMNPSFDLYATYESGQCYLH